MSDTAPENQEPGQVSGDQHGWAPDLDEKTGQAERATGKAFDADNAGPPGPERSVSQEEREGVPPTDTTAASPLGVGQSTRRPAEDTARANQETGRQDQGTQGPSERPVGTSTAEDSTGIDPQEPSNETADLQTGDQGG
jgi:hypothetical protein